MPNSGLKLPKLPAGWSYVNEDLPPEEPSPLTGAESTRQAGSALRSIMGPLPEEEQPTFIKNFLKPTAEKTFDVLVPHTPKDIGIFAASLMFGGPLGPLARGAAKVAPAAVPALEAMGASWVRRLAGTALGGILGAEAGGDSPVMGGIQGLATALGGEAVAKLSKFLRMNKQAADLAVEDPERLGEVVQQVIPGLKDIRSARDFHAAFKKSGAQTVLSKAYTEGMGEVSNAMQGQLIPSQVMSSVRGPARSTTAMDPAWRGRGAADVLGGGGTGEPGKYSIDDLAETIRRLRHVGWNGDELARGLAARDARQTADALQMEVMSSLPPEVGEKFARTNEWYSRGKRLIDFFDDKELLDAKGNLNIQRLQRKVKSEGYSVGESLQIAADAKMLEEGLFRGAPAMVEDVSPISGKGLEKFHWHFGFIPTATSRMPQPGAFAGRSNYGVSPTTGSQLMQLLKRGTTRDDVPPISLVAPTGRE